MISHTLEAQSLSKDFIQANKTLPVLRNISVTFHQGRAYAITGVSGSGKSTFLHLMGGLDTPSAGAVLFNGHNLYELRTRKREKILNASLGFVFQFHYLINELSVLENIMLMGLIKGEKRAACRERALFLLNHVGLASKAETYPFELSGGEQQRVSILRAIFNKPQFLLADEPTGNLDAGNASMIVDFLLACRAEWDMGIILCTHDQAVYQRMDHVMHLSNGTLAVR